MLSAILLPQPASGTMFRKWTRYFIPTDYYIGGGGGGGPRGTLGNFGKVPQDF